MPIKTIDNKRRLFFKRKVKELIGEHVKCPDDFLFSSRSALSPVRKEMVDQCNGFDGSLNNSSQFTSIPKSLLYLISTLIDGFSPTDNNFTQETFSVVQIIMWNYHKSNKKVNDGQLIKRHDAKTRETPMMIYIPLKIYSVTRSRNLIDMLFNLRLCISYDRVLEITKNIYETMHESYENNKFFFPNILIMGLFTFMLKDKIDLDSKSNFIQCHYQGTSRSMIQFKTNENEGTPFRKVNVSKVVQSSNKSKKHSSLPSEYTTIKDLFQERTKNEKLWAPLCNVNFSDIIDF